VAEDKNSEEEKFDFTSEGEGLFTLGDARMLAVRTAAESPGDYGRNFRNVTMVFEIAESGEEADYYTVTLSVRPQGNFVGTPGQEQFLIRQDGTITVRQVLSTPIQTSASPAGTASKGGGFLVLPVAIGVVIVGAIAAVGAVLALGTSSGDSVPIAAVTPTETPAPTETYTPVSTYTPYPTYTPIPVPTARVIVVTPTFTPRPTYTRIPTPTATPDCTMYKGPPHLFVGKVYMDGGPAADGATVSAWVDGELVAYTSASGGEYLLLVDQSKTCIDLVGKSISFKVSGANAPGTITWEAGGAHQNIVDAMTGPS
jgi:hypothetical protein